MTVEKLRVREPVNNGRRNHRTFSRKQLATVHDANAQDTSTILATPTNKAKLDGAAPSTPPVLRKSLSFVAVCRRAQTDVSRDETIASSLSPSASSTTARSVCSGTRCSSPTFIISRALSARSAWCWIPCTGVIWTPWCASASPQNVAKNSASVLSYVIQTKVPPGHP